MTLLIHRRLFLGFMLFVVVIILGVAAYEFRVITAVASGGLEAKVAAEQILFISIVFAAVVLIAGTAVIVRAVSFTAILDKLVGMNRMTGFTPELTLNRLGEVGRKITLLYRQASELSAKKSRKIGGLSALVEHLMTLSGELVIVSDSAGKVVHASKSLIEGIGKPRSQIVGTALTDLIPEADVSAAVRSTARTRDPFVVKTNGDSVVFNPIFSSDGEVHYMVALLTKAATGEMRKVTQPAADPGTPVRKKLLLPRVFGRRKSR